MLSYFLIIFAVVALDQASKIWIVEKLEAPITVIPGFFTLVFYTNKGAAFSFLANVDSPLRHYFFVVVGIVAFVGLFFANRTFRKENKLYSISLGLIAGGAVGNLIDRLRFGYVVDFLDFNFGRYHYPAFNVADSAICVGVALFLVLSFKGNGKKK